MTQADIVHSLLYSTYFLIVCALWVLTGGVYMVTSMPEFLKEMEVGQRALELFERNRSTPKLGVLVQLQSAADAAEFARLKGIVRAHLLTLWCLFGPVVAVMTVFAWLRGMYRAAFAGAVKTNVE